MANTIQQLEDLKEWSQNSERYERRLAFRGGQLVQPGPGRPGYAGRKGMRTTTGMRSQLIDLFISDKIKTGSVKGETTGRLAQEFNKGDWFKKIKDPQFENIRKSEVTFKNKKLPEVKYTDIWGRIKANPKFDKEFSLSYGRKVPLEYEVKIKKGIEAYKKLPDKKKFAMQTGGIGYGELDKFMKKHDLLRKTEGKVGKVSPQHLIDKVSFRKRLEDADVWVKAPLMPKHEQARKIKAKRIKTIQDVGSTAYEQHLESYKRAIQKYIGVPQEKLKTGKKMYPMDMAHRTDIQQLQKLGAKLNPSDLGVDYYKLNREGVTKEGIKSVEMKLARLYEDQETLYKKAKKLNKIPEDLSKQIFLNNDEILKTIGESPLKGRLKPITLNPVTLEIKKGSVIVDDVTKQLGIGLIEKPMAEIQYSRSIKPGGAYAPQTLKKYRKAGSMDDAFIKLTIGEQVLKEAVDQGLVDEKVARKKLDKFMGKVSPEARSQATALHSFPANLQNPKFLAKEAIEGGKLVGKGLGKTLAGAFGPTGAAGLWAGFGGVDLKDPWDRGGLAAEAALAPSLVKSTEYATKGIKNPLVKQGVQRALNLGMSLPMAMRFARIASPIGWASLAGEGIYHAGKKEMARREQMSPQELEDFHLERQSRGWSRMGRAGGGIAGLSGGKRFGPPPESGPVPYGGGLSSQFNRVRKLTG